MKILKLTFRNINSLYGAWCIDFEDPAFKSSNLFALTGKTGSGKTSVLDAVLLALYGETPRMGAISESGRNEVISRGTQSCFSSLEFEINKVKYRADWKYERRAKRGYHLTSEDEWNDSNSSATLVHEITNLQTGLLITNQRKETKSTVEEIIGLNAEQFKKTVLLAQGDFDRFLASKDREKSDLFEKITGTEIYTEISKTVFRRHKSEKEKLGNITADIEKIHLLSDEETAGLKESIDKLKGERTRKNKERDELRSQIDAAERIENLESDISDIQSKKGEKSKEIEDFRKDSERLDAAQRALQLEGEYSKLVTKESDLSRDQADLKSQKEKCPDLEEKCGNAKRDFEDAGKKLEAAKDEEKKERPVIQEVRELDRQIHDELEKSEARQKKIKETEENIRAYDSEKTEIVKKISSQEVELEKITRYADEHTNDQLLIGEFGSIESELNNLNEMKREFDRKKSEFNEAEKDLGDAAKKRDENAEEMRQGEIILRQAEEKYAEAKKRLESVLDGKTRSEYEMRKDFLITEREFHRVIRTLDGHRANLKDGEACPLCGSLSHPYALGNIPTENETEKNLGEIEKRLSEIDRAEKDDRELKDVKAEKEGKYQELKNRLKLSEQEHSSKTSVYNNLKDEVSRKEEQVKEKAEALSVKTKPFGIEEIGRETLSELKERIVQWNEVQKKKDEILETLRGFKNDLDILKVKYDNESKQLDSDKDEFRKNEENLKELKEKRTGLYGDKVPDEEEKRLSGQTADAERFKEETADLKEKFTRELAVSQKEIERLNGEIQRKTDELNLLRPAFDSQLREKHFDSLEQFENARISDSERQELAAQKTRLDKEFQELNARLEENIKQLENIRKEKSVEKSRKELVEEKFVLEQNIKEIDDRLQGENSRQSADEQNRERFTALKKDLDIQQKVCERWKELNDLIGSEKGDKYRTFVQGLTFDEVVYYANEQLRKISNRYQLRRILNSVNLDLEVIDNEQAGEIRPTANLSGGERFMVSLALALGISRIAGKNIRIDSLFLDEGFGTLDEQSLDKAISALESLNQEGKLIGIITHVPQLQGDESRIQTQIHVTPNGRGRSSLSGPGVSKY